MMKQLIALLLLAGLATAPTEAKRKEKRPADVRTEQPDSLSALACMELQRARVERDLDSLRREFGYAMWSRYLEEQMRRELPVDYRKLPAFDMERFCQKVPELTDLQRIYTELNKSCKRICEARPEYEGLRREYRIAFHADDKQAIAKSKADYEAFYNRLEREDSVYRRVERQRKMALRERNYAVLRHLIADYRSRKAIMPVDGAIGTDHFQTKLRLFRDFPELERMEQNITVLTRIQYDLTREIMKQRYLSEPMQPDARE